MKPEDRKQLARILSTADEAFLVALANKGLVRRAEKDLEGATLHVEETDEHIVVKGADWTVWMPSSGPANAKDDTKATGITRQILSATIHLRDHWSALNTPEPPKAIPSTVAELGGAPDSIPSPVVPGLQAPDSTPNSVAPEAAAPDASVTPSIIPHTTPDESLAIKEALLDITVPELSRYAGKKIVADLLALMKDAVEVEVECNVGVILRLPQHDLEIRCLPTRSKGTRLLEELLSTAPSAMHKRWVATAVIALQRSEGKQVQAIEQQVKEAAEAPRTRQQVLHETQKLLESMLANGISHPSGRTVERLFTLSLSAAAVHLPRLSGLLRSLSDEVSHLLTRHASADTHRLFASMSWTYALSKALDWAGASPPAELTGLARTQYDAAGDLELQGVGCYPWQTASGFNGFTILFWNPDSKRFLTWSNSRPASGALGFKPSMAYISERVWSGAAGGTPARLSRSRFVLKNARVNPLGRLSAAQQSSIDDLTARPLSDIDFNGRLFTSWNALRDYAAEQFPVGLKSRNPLDRIVILEPKSWDERFFDEMQQSFCWTMVDKDSILLKLTMPWSPLNEPAIEFLESFKPGLDKVNRIVARIDFTGSGFAVEPLSFLSHGTRRGDYVLNPAFDSKLIESQQKGLLARLKQKWGGGRERVETKMTSDEEWDEMLFEDSASETLPTGIRMILSETEGLLLQVAESGVQRLHERTLMRFRDLSERSARCGLSALGETLGALAIERPDAGRVMWSEYLCKVHKQTHVQFAKLK